MRSQLMISQLHLYIFIYIYTDKVYDMHLRNTYIHYVCVIPYLAGPPN